MRNAEPGAESDRPITAVLTYHLYRTLPYCPNQVRMASYKSGRNSCGWLRLQYDNTKIASFFDGWKIVNIDRVGQVYRHSGNRHAGFYIIQRMWNVRIE